MPPELGYYLVLALSAGTLGRVLWLKKRRPTVYRRVLPAAWCSVGLLGFVFGELFIGSWPGLTVSLASVAIAVPLSVRAQRRILSEHLAHRQLSAGDAPLTSADELLDTLDREDVEEQRGHLRRAFTLGGGVVGATSMAFGVMTGIPIFVGVGTVTALVGAFLGRRVVPRGPDPVADRGSEVSRPLADPNQLGRIAD